METPGDLKFSETHEWARLNDDGTITVGISHHAQDQLGDLVFVEVPEIDAEVKAEDAVAVVESVKALQPDNKDDLNSMMAAGEYDTMVENA